MKRFRITVVQGAIHINCIHAVGSSDHAILLEADTRQKFPVIGFSFRDEVSFGAALCADRNTLHVVRGTGGQYTEIRFHGLSPRAWVLVTEVVGRYSVRFALVKKRGCQLLWGDDMPEAKRRAVPA